MSEELEPFHHIFIEAQGLLDKLFALRDHVVKMSVDNTFTTDERIKFLNDGINMIPDAITFVNNSTNALVAMRFLLQDHAEVINQLRTATQTEVQDESTGE